MDQKVEITPSGDRELWLVSGEDWVIPVFADPYESKEELKRCLFLISPAHALLKPQLDALSGAIVVQSIGQANNTAWWFEQAVFKSLATKAPGITPKYYYKWEGKVVNPNPTIPQQADVDGSEITSDAEKFLRFVAQRTAMFTMTQLRLMWRALYWYGIEWLVKEQKFLDLGWCQIHPVPYRRNWKEIMLAKHPKSPTMFLRDDPNFFDALRFSGFESDLYSTELVALDKKDHFFHWTLEVIPRRPWAKAVLDAEKIRRATKGPTQYASYYIRQVQNRLSTVLDAYRAYIKEISRPCGNVVEDGVSGAQRIVPYVPTGLVTAQATKAVDTAIMVSDKPGLKGPSPGRKVAAAIEEVRKMPDLLNDAPDVRDSGKAVENPVTKSFEQQGCMCEMTLKVQFPEVSCWKKEATLGQMSEWPEELNG